MLQSERLSCPVCGEPVTTSVAGLCPRCLLRTDPGGATNPDARQGADDAAGAPSDVASHTLPLSPGEGTPGVVHVPSDDGSSSAQQPSTDGIVPSGPAARLELFEQIGRGGMGVVLRARDPDLRRELAVKVLRDDLRHSPEMVRRFVEEAQIAGQLQHPGIVPIHELGRFDDDRPFFTMKLVKGRTLSQLLAEAKTSDAGKARALSIFEQVCQTVAYAHAHGVIHRDLKPSNVMVGRFGEVQVMDWGLAKVLARGSVSEPSEPSEPETVIATARSLSDSDLSRAGSVLGTPSYMAPEQARGDVDAVDERSDVFALGSILCEILTGFPAFTGRRTVDIQRKAAEGNLKPAWDRLDACGADAELLALARDCLAPERDGRPRDAGVLAARLSAYLAGVQERLRAAEVARGAESARAEEATRTAEVARAQVRAEQRARRLTAALAVAGVGLVAIGGGAAAWFQRQDAHRAATTALLVNNALNEAKRREGEARSLARNDPAGWDAALAEAHRAADLLEQGRASTALRGRVSTVLAELTEQRHEAAERAKLLQVDRKLLDDLDQARNSAFLDLTAVDQGYTEAFLNAGLAVDQSRPDAVGAWVASRPNRAEIAVYLDDWAHIRRYIKLRPDQYHDIDLVAAARVADPDDPWRDRLRAAHNDPTALRSLADNEPDLEEQTARSLHLLAIGLKDEARDLERAIRVLRIALRRFPNHFWINVEMSICMDAKVKAAKSPAERDRWRAEHVRFMTAAIVSRPQSHSVRIALGDLLVSMGRPDEALELYRGATRLVYNGPHPYTRLGLALREQRKIVEAEAAFREALQITPGDSRAHMELGNILRDQGKLDSSVAELRKAVELAPEASIIRFYLGASYAVQGKLDDAIAAYRETFRLERKRNHVGDVPFALAKLYHTVGRPDDALAVLTEALRLKPDSIRAHDYAAEILLSQGRRAEALEHDAEAFRLDPMNDFRGFRLAVLYLAAGDDAGYRRHCLAMLDRYGNMTNGSWASRAGLSCLLSNKPVELKQATQLAKLYLDPSKVLKPGTLEHAWAYMNVALAEYRNGRFDEALELLQAIKAPSKVIRLRTDALLAMSYLALGLEDEGRRRLAECQKILAAGVDAFGKDTAWHEWLLFERFCHEAEALLRRGTAVPADRSAGASAVGVDSARVNTLVQAGRINEAIAEYREAVVRKPDDALAERDLGEFLAGRGKWEDAAKSLERVAELDPADARLWFEIASLHLALGNDAAYRRCCLAMLERFGSKVPLAIGHTVKSCMLSPTPVAFDKVFALAKQEYERARSGSPKAAHHGWWECDWALAQYRAGHFDDAANHCKKCRGAGGLMGLEAECLLAMCYQRLGLKREAARLLSACRATLRSAAERPAGWGQDWVDYLSCELFCREAESLIGDDPARPPGATAPAPPDSGPSANPPAPGNKP
jgi:serine/threonine-protein kinase